MSEKEIVRTRIDSFRKIRVVDLADKQQCTFKPVGFWYSVDGDWERWCRDNEPSWLAGKYVHLVELGDERIRMIRTLTELRLFQKKYGVLMNYGYLHIDWPRVARDYDGIEIAPYQWQHRQELWYYGWDCASGCIWRPDGVQVARKNKNRLSITP